MAFRCLSCNCPQNTLCNNHDLPQLVSNITPNATDRKLVVSHLVPDQVYGFTINVTAHPFSYAEPLDYLLDCIGIVLAGVLSVEGIAAYPLCCPLVNSTVSAILP